MVFSFFKKPPEKMVAKPSVVPKSKQSEGAVTCSSANQPDPAASGYQTGSGSVISSVAPQISAFSDFVFSESSLDFHVETEISPVDAHAEEAAILYANHQDEAVRAVLENVVREHVSPSGARLWLMLLDFYRLSGNRTAFESLGIEYAQGFERSPPGWVDKTTVPSTAEIIAGNLSFRGELIGDNTVVFESIRRALEKNPHLRLELSNVRQFDSAGCGQLLSLMQHARKLRRPVGLLGIDALAVLLQSRLVTGVAQDRDCWLLFLELCQLQGRNEIFENTAVDYAVTFEVSPPSWEADRAPSPDLAHSAPVTVMKSVTPVDTYVLQGDIRASRFGDLSLYAGSHDSVVIDCSRLTRMDFVSVGALLNVLTTIRQSGKPIIFQYPNHLVAELFSVVRLNAVATIVFEKY